ncbi:MAG: alpha/beta fold hydrolase [Candidatus Sericytochromatia bacterium]
MRRGLLTFLSALAVMAAGPLLLFMAAFLLTWKDYPVPATVSNNPSLPRLIIDQVTLHAEIFGDRQAPVLLVLHDGPGQDYSSLLPLKALSDRYRVVFYDQRGSGLSARVPNQKLTIQESLKELEKVIEQVSPERPIYLFGHGWGGMLAAAYAGKHPSKIDKLLLAEPGFLNTDMANRILPALSRTSVSFIWNTTLAWVRSLHIHGPDSDAAADYVYSQIHFQPRYHCAGKQNQDIPLQRSGFRAWKTITQSTFSKDNKIAIDFVQGLAQLKGPVLFLVSECNSLTGKDFQTRQMRLFPQAQMALVKGSGHAFFQDKPTESLKQIRQFLNPK